jgi:carbon monoxide dehydrogenase subunit G
MSPLLGFRRDFCPDFFDFEATMLVFKNTEDLHSLWPQARNCLQNAAFLASCVPNARLGDANYDSASWIVSPSLAILSQSIATTLHVTDRRSDRIVLGVENRTSGATLTATGEFVFREPHVDWSATIASITGLLKLVPQPVLRVNAERMLTELWRSIRIKLEASV